MNNLKEMNRARDMFEQQLLVSGIPFEWDGKRYTRANVQTKWRYFCLGFFAKTKEKA